MARTYHQQPFALPDGACELIFVRHGASEPAVEGVAFGVRDGQADPPLDAVGHEQAQRVAARLAAEDTVSVLVHTGLTRTEQTAAPIAEALGLQPVAVPPLREVFLGDWDGAEFRIRIMSGDPVALQAVAQERWDVIPGAESSEALAARVRRGLDEAAELARVHPVRRAIVVAHGGIIAEVCHQATGSRPFAFVSVENCSVSRVVVFADGTLRLRSFNDTAHLL